MCIYTLHLYVIVFHCSFLEVANILFVYLHKNYIMAIENIHWYKSTQCTTFSWPRKHQKLCLISIKGAVRRRFITYLRGYIKTASYKISWTQTFLSFLVMYENVAFIYSWSYPLKGWWQTLIYRYQLEVFYNAYFCSRF